AGTLVEALAPEALVLDAKLARPRQRVGVGRPDVHVDVTAQPGQLAGQRVQVHALAAALHVPAVAEKGYPHGKRPVATRVPYSTRLLGQTQSKRCSTFESRLENAAFTRKARKARVGAALSSSSPIRARTPQYGEWKACAKPTPSTRT